MSILDRIQNSEISRRAFLKGTVAATTAVAGLGMVGFSKDNVLTETDAAAAAGKITPETVASADHAAIVNPEEGGEWVAASCWHNCAGRCCNKVMVKDGVVIRQKTDDSHEDSWDYMQQRACQRGRAQQQQCFGADRLRYPMKRKNWQPGGGENTHGELRGIDEWERISWEEAFKLVAEETQRIYAENNNEPVCMARTGDCAKHIMAYMGGYMSYADTTSFGTYCFNVTKLGLPAYDLGMANDRYDMKNADYIVFQGGNPAWASSGSRTWNWKQAKDAGAKFVMVGPSYNATASLFDAKWIQVRSGTDTPFLLAVVYEMLKLDEEKGNIIDWDFMNKYTIGFDDEHMPEGAKLNENLKGYVLGQYDGIAKTAEWATEICGTPVEDIKWFAEMMGKQNKVTYLHSFSHARNRNAEDVPQIFMTVGCLGAHFGKPGHACGAMYASDAGNCGSALVKAGGTGMQSNAPKNSCSINLNGPTMWQSVMKGTANNNANYYAGFYGPEDIRDIKVKMMYWDGDARLQTSPDLSNGIKVMRSLDFVCCNAQFLTTQAKYADIVMPVTTQWERVGGFLTGNRDSLFVYTQVTKPLYEAKDDEDICKGILEAMGMGEKYAEIWPMNKGQRFLNQLAGTKYAQADGTMATLCTITAENVAEFSEKWGYELELEPQEGLIPVKKFLADGCYTVERHEGDNLGFIAYADYLADPEANPRPSDSGKFEIYNDWKADMLNSMGYSDGWKPYPSYTIAPEGYETTFKDGDIHGEKGEYPFLVYNPHYMRRSHSVFDNCPWLRETWPNPVFLNKADAQAKGIKTGDTVKIWNAHGAILRTASLTNTLMPGQVGVPHGSWVDWDDKNNIDRGGADNILCGPVISGMGVTGYNNYNCNFELYDGEPLVPDCEKPQRIINI